MAFKHLTVFQVVKCDVLVEMYILTMLEDMEFEMTEFIKLLIENKLIIYALGNLHYQISKWHSSQGEDLNMRTMIAQVVERRARNPEVRGSNRRSGLNFSIEI